MSMKLVDSDSASSPLAVLPDIDIVRQIRDGETTLFDVLMRRHKQRVYRVVRAVMNKESDVEDVMQQTYMNAFTHLHQFEERAQFSTWLTRIAVNEAFATRRKVKAPESVVRIQFELDDDRRGYMDTLISPDADPERQAYAQELRRVLEAAVEALPDNYRSVFMLRDIEGLSTSDTGEKLGLGEEAVKSRLHRARAMIRRAVTKRIGGIAAEAFPFHALRCGRVVAAVLTGIAQCS
jgi:RNA polymerase sigma-70 factor (ECF subfamily)